MENNYVLGSQDSYDNQLCEEGLFPSLLLCSVGRKLPCFLIYKTCCTIHLQIKPPSWLPIVSMVVSLPFKLGQLHAQLNSMKYSTETDQSDWLSVQYFCYTMSSWTWLVNRCGAYGRITQGYYAKPCPLLKCFDLGIKPAVWVILSLLLRWV